VNQALPLLIVAALEAGAAAYLPLPLALLFGWAAAATGFVGLAYVLGRPSWLGKRRPLLRAALAPYLAFGRFVAAGVQRLGHVERNEVLPGLWVGGWPRKGAPGLAQLDLTAELPRRGAAREYRCVEMLDGTAMSGPAFAEAVDQALAWRRAGLPVLIHCAYGHGRSVSVACGLILAEGLAPDLDAAFALIQAHRKGAALRPYQRAVVEAWWAGRDQ
jgi:hypothetical protein